MSTIFKIPGIFIGSWSISTGKSYVQSPGCYPLKEPDPLILYSVGWVRPF